jgi:hypothetical protein
LRLGTARATRAGLGEGTSFRLTIGLGAVTVISGRAVAPPVAAGACASWANAALPNAHSNAELKASNACLDGNDTVLILPKPNPLTDCGLPSMSDGPISIDLGETGHAWRGDFL